MFGSYIIVCLNNHNVLQSNKCRWTSNCHPRPNKKDRMFTQQHALLNELFYLPSRLGEI